QQLQHRSVQIQAVRLLTESILENPSEATTPSKDSNKPLEKLWSFVNSKVPIVSSIAANSVATLVRAGVITWREALNDLNDTLTTADGLILDNVVGALTTTLILSL